MHKKNVLIVEDQWVVAESLKIILSLIPDLQWFWAPNGLEGLKTARQGAWDLIISDYKMPEMDGLQMIQKLREENYDTPIILFSGQSDLISAAQIIELRLSVLPKPSSIEKIIACVKQELISPNFSMTMDRKPEKEADFISVSYWGNKQAASLSPYLKNSRWAAMSGQEVSQENLQSDSREKDKASVPA